MLKDAEDAFVSTAFAVSSGFFVTSGFDEATKLILPKGFFFGSFAVGSGFFVATSGLDEATRLMLPNGFVGFLVSFCFKNLKIQQRPTKGRSQEAPLAYIYIY